MKEKINKILSSIDSEIGNFDMKHQKLTRLPFFRHCSSGNINGENIIDSYNDFAIEIYNLYQEQDNYREVIFTLSYIDTELQHLLAESSDKIYIGKAIALVQKTLYNLQQELKCPISLDKRKLKVRYRWTESTSDFVELIYSLVELRGIEYGNVNIKEFVAYLGELLGVDIKDSQDTYMGIKRRKNDSRTYFLDKLAYTLNKKMNLEDGLESPTPSLNIPKTLFDDH